VRAMLLDSHSIVTIKEPNLFYCVCTYGFLPRTVCFPM
jgi:hypothetical protein